MNKQILRVEETRSICGEFPLCPLQVSDAFSAFGASSASGVAPGATLEMRNARSTSPTGDHSFLRMARTPSTMLPLGTTAPDFRLPDTNGKSVSIADFADKPALLVMFICNHCPYVKHVRSELAKLGRDYMPRGAGIVAINSNDVANYPEDSPEGMAAEAKAAGYDFPYLFDASQEVARSYHAACTPDFFLFDRSRKLVYRGQLDDSRPNNGIPVTGKDLRAALDMLLGGKSITTEQKPSLGCNIKWKAGNEPDYFGA